jgi:hypothetical protein
MIHQLELTAPEDGTYSPKHALPEADPTAGNSLVFTRIKYQYFICLPPREKP